MDEQTGVVIVLPRGLTARPATMADAGVVTDLVMACEDADDSEVMTDHEDVPSEWSRPSFDPSRDVLLVFEGEALVAYAEVHGARWAWGSVHPDHRGRGIGSALVEWTEAHARREGGAVVGQTVSENEAGAVTLLTSRGYASRWISWVLEIDLSTRPAQPRVPDGATIRSFQPGQDDRAVYRVIEDAFNEWSDRTPTTFEDWSALTVGRSDFDPELVWVAVIDHRIVGVALGFAGGDEGWVQQLAVGRSHRGLGLGGALLHRAFMAFHDRGATKGGLSTNSRTGALGLYEHVGMGVRRTYTHFALEL